MHPIAKHTKAGALKHPAPPAPVAPLGRPSAGEGEPSNWRWYAAAILRMKWVILGVTLLGGGVGVAVARQMKQSYRAQSTVWIEVAERGGNSQGPIRPGELLRSYAWVELLKSFTILEHAVREQRLFISAASEEDRQALRSLDIGDRYRPGRYRLHVEADGKSYTLATSSGILVERGTVGAPVGKEVGILWQPTARELKPGRTIDFGLLNIRDLAAGLGDQIEAQMQEDGNFLRLSLSGPDPVRVTALLNSVTDRYVSVAAQLKRAKLDELTGVLADQLRYAEGNLRDAEAALESFRVQTITLPSGQSTPVTPGLQETRDPVMSSFFDLKVRREQVRSDRAALEQIMAQVRSGTFNVDALASLPVVQSAPQLNRALQESTQKHADLRALAQRYTPEHAGVQRLQSEINQLDRVTIPAFVNQLRAQLVSQENLMDARILGASQELQQIPPRAIEEARLERRVEVAKNLHGELKQRFEEARLAAASSIPDVHMLDRAAVPDAPISDRRPMVILGALAGSLGLALLVVLLRERTDPRVRYPEQVTQGLRLPILGTVPHVDPDHIAEHAQVIEAFREVRLALMHAHGAARPMMLTISSPGSGDGKSFITANLGIACAMLGDRVLIIDGDVRRARMHRLMDVQRGPGLTDCLSGQASWKTALQSTSFPGLSILGAGTPRRDGPQLLGSTTLRTLVGELHGHFDVILFDSAPLGAGTDAFILGTVAHHMVVVLRTGESDRRLAEAKLDLVDRLPVRVLGAILNDFVPNNMYRYYSYLPGYEPAEVEDEAPKQLLTT